MLTLRPCATCGARTLRPGSADSCAPCATLRATHGWIHAVPAWVYRARTGTLPARIVGGIAR